MHDFSFWDDEGIAPYKLLAPAFGMLGGFYKISAKF